MAKLARIQKRGLSDAERAEIEANKQALLGTRVQRGGPPRATETGSSIRRARPHDGAHHALFASLCRGATPREGGIREGHQHLAAGPEGAPLRRHRGRGPRPSRSAGQRSSRLACWCHKRVASFSACGACSSESFTSLSARCRLLYLGPSRSVEKPASHRQHSPGALNSLHLPRYRVDRDHHRRL